MTYDDVRQRQMIYAPTLLGCSLLAGVGAAFVWHGSAFPWWARAFAILAVLLCLFIAYQAYVQLREARKELRHLERFGKANRHGPEASPLQSPNARRDGNKGMGGFNPFDGRKG